jgi:hypothetical protein
VVSVHHRDPMPMNVRFPPNIAVHGIGTERLGSNHCGRSVQPRRTARSGLENFSGGMSSSANSDERSTPLAGLSQEFVEVTQTGIAGSRMTGAPSLRMCHLR